MQRDDVRACEARFLAGGEEVPAVVFADSVVGEHIPRAPRFAVAFVVSGDRSLKGEEIAHFTFQRKAPLPSLVSARCYDADGDVVFERNGGSSSILTKSTSTAIILKPDSAIPDGNFVFAVQDANSVNRLTVASNDRVTVNDALLVAEGATFNSTVGVTGATTLTTLTNSGNATLGGGTTTFPSGMTAMGEVCIDNTQRNPTSWGNALRICTKAGKSLCSYTDYMMCDQLEPATSSCTLQTDTSSAVLWTADRHGERDDFDESWENNIKCFRGDNEVVECSVNDSRNYYCCAHGVFSGTP